VRVSRILVGLMSAATLAPLQAATADSQPGCEPDPEGYVIRCSTPGIPSEAPSLSTTRAFPIELPPADREQEVPFSVGGPVCLLTVSGVCTLGVSGAGPGGAFEGTAVVASGTGPQAKFADIVVTACINHPDCSGGATQSVSILPSGGSVDPSASFTTEVCVTVLGATDCYPLV
jgi:hypothetical protein